MPEAYATLGVLTGQTRRLRLGALVTSVAYRHPGVLAAQTTRFVIPVVVNGDIDSCDSAEQALLASGADAVMIGRATRGRPWLGGQIARHLAGGRRETAPALETQLAIIDRLYDELLCHYGVTIGIRVARKHLGWALDAAAATAGESRKPSALARQRVLTGDDPRAVRRHLAETFASLADGERRAA